MAAYPTDLPPDAPFTQLAAELTALVDAAERMLRGISETDASRSIAAGKWSTKQTLGHLIDSAANNHQRFVRVQDEPSLTFPGYAQDVWVAVQRYDARPWGDLVGLWTAYNRHLVHVIGHINDAEGRKICTVGDSAPVSLHALVRDYVGHIQHHLRQVSRVSRQA